MCVTTVRACFSPFHSPLDHNSTPPAQSGPLRLAKSNSHIVSLLAIAGGFEQDLLPLLDRTGLQVLHVEIAFATHLRCWQGREATEHESTKVRPQSLI